MDEAQLVERCDDCGGSMRLHLSQSVVYGAIEWSIYRRCDDCASESYACGHGETPEPLRAALIDQCGPARLRIDRVESSPVRVRLMRVLRDGGAGLAEAKETLDRLTGEGVTGTRAEMELLAGRLSAAGATPSVT